LQFILELFRGKTGAGEFELHRPGFCRWCNGYVDEEIVLTFETRDFVDGYLRISTNGLRIRSHILAINHQLNLVILHPCPPVAGIHAVDVQRERLQRENEKTK